MKKRSRFYYNLVEITLAMAVVGIGIAGIMALFVPALDSSKESVAENYSSQVATTLLSYIERFKRNNWTTASNVWYTINTQPALPPALSFYEGCPDTRQWRVVNGNTTSEILPGVFSLNTIHGAGVYGLTLGNDVEDLASLGTYFPDGRKFCGFARVWQENVSASEFFTGGDSAVSAAVNSVVNNGDQLVRIYVEISYPATVPPENRKISLYIFEIGRPQ
ncbi:MAG: hypothetical protein IKA79_09705 [Lentisphaeria bacterium]|nr:hypothetical protein [Lentisphaeria bacterium]